METASFLPPPLQGGGIASQGGLVLWSRPALPFVCLGEFSLFNFLSGSEVDGKAVRENRERRGEKKRTSCGGTSH